MPEAQRWKEVPDMQFHWPSVLQLPVRAPELELEADPELEGEEVVAGAGEAAEEDVGSGSASALDGIASGIGAADAKAAATEALSTEAAGEAEEAEPDDTEPEEAEPEAEPDELEAESELELEVVSPEPPKVAVPVQASEPSLARLAGSPSYST